MKYYLIAGEASGDLHASNLMKEILLKDPEAEFRFWGGDLMEAVGGELVKHYRDLAFMGFIEVVANLRTILSNIKFCKADIQAYKPDAVILVDYPGFNLRIAEFVKELGIKVFYYISPQIWAWKQNRVHKIKRVVDRMITILPFEKDFYAKFDMEVDYVGHPLLDAIHNRDLSEERNKQLKAEFGLDEREMVLVMPGSRKQEISAVLPTMLRQRQHFPNHQFVIAAAPGLDESYFADFLNQLPKNEAPFKIIKGRTYDLLQIAKAALVTSGTATLETALFRVPEVVCYKGSYISYQIAKRVIKVNYISLVNLIMDEEVVRELIQGEFNESLLRTELGKLLKDERSRDEMIASFDTLINKLGGGGASKKAADIIISEL
ncbi:MAG: lipid-A-disaccharide synthase [Flavobacteriales bacterium]|nr:lipid-A-disaccharide synthase [Flavobacteriales bacterium]|tara:strand:- start:560 stop:1690 length:1131 start_codon:yes stop_codon:yes gene_type:complete